MAFPWDDRDEELNLRDRLAQIIAEKCSGNRFANPSEEDYALADEIGSRIEEWLRA
jgi:hypothetical protein